MWGRPFCLALLLRKSGSLGGGLDGLAPLLFDRRHTRDRLFCLALLLGKSGSLGGGLGGPAPGLLRVSRDQKAPTESQRSRASVHEAPKRGTRPQGTVPDVILGPDVAGAAAKERGPAHSIGSRLSSPGTNSREQHRDDHRRPQSCLCRFCHVSVLLLASPAQRTGATLVDVQPTHPVRGACREHRGRSCHLHPFPDAVDAAPTCKLDTSNSAVKREKRHRTARAVTYPK